MGSLADEDLAEGLRFAEHGLWNEAIEAFDKVLVRQPERADATFHQARAYFGRWARDHKKRDLDEAERLARQSQALDPRYRPPYELLQKIRQSRGRRSAWRSCLLALVVLLLVLVVLPLALVWLLADDAERWLRRQAEELGSGCQPTLRIEASPIQVQTAPQSPSDTNINVNIGLPPGALTPGGPREVTVGRGEIPMISATLATAEPFVEWSVVVPDARLVTFYASSADFEPVLALLQAGREVQRSSPAEFGVGARLVRRLEPGPYTLRLSAATQPDGGNFLLRIF
jgi:hypothetical protein